MRVDGGPRSGVYRFGGKNNLMSKTRNGGPWRFTADLGVNFMMC